MFIVKIHHIRGKTILAVCDAELLGKKYSEGKKQLDLTSSFYAGEKMGEGEFKEIAWKQNIVNMVGDRITKLALDMGLIIQNQIIRINKIPHAQMLNLNPIT